MRVHKVRNDKLKAGFESWHLLMADVHYDSPWCNRKLFFRHLEQAKERKAKVYMFGDTLDAMQGRGDPRRSKDELDETYNDDEYLDLLVRDLGTKLDKYKHLIEVVSLGNHEDAVLTHYGTNLARRLAERVKAEYFGYNGFIKFQFTKDKKSSWTTKLLYFHHGGGGNSPVTKGVIGTNRRQVYLPDADIVVTGHIHQSWLMPVARIRVSQQDKVYKDVVYHVQLPTYKDEFGHERGFPVKKEMAPGLVGAWWLRFYWDVDAYDRVGVELTMAQ